MWKRLPSSFLLAIALAFAGSAARADLPVVDVSTPNATLHLEVADREATREHGLMDRTVLAPHAGMLFVFRGQSKRYFWMKDTLIPLDMIFLDARGVITTIAAKVPATTPDTADIDIPTRAGLAKFVIELNAGEAQADGLIPGVLLKIPPFTGL